MIDTIIVMVLASSLAGNFQHFRNAIRLTKVETIIKMMCPTCAIKKNGDGD